MAELVKLQLETLFMFDSAGRIISTREPQAKPGPAFMLIRSTAGCAWGIRSDVSAKAADELNRLAMEEPPLTSLRAAPLHAERYQSITGGRVRSGPAFTFPQAIPRPADVVMVEDEQVLGRYFSGWVPGEIRAGRAPVMAVMENG